MPRVEPTAQRARRDTGALERTKELDFEQRPRLLRVKRATLSLMLLRRVLKRFWGRTAPAGARPVPRPPAGTVALTLVGHATVMLTTPRVRVLTDPMLEATFFGLPRARAAALDETDLDDVRLVLISHAHRDHLAVKSLARVDRRATVVVPERCQALIASLGFARVVELGVGQEVEVEGVRIIAVPARHSGRRRVFDRTRRGANGYVIRAEGRCVYFAGDTGYFSGFGEIGRRYAPEIALLPIAGYQPAPFRDEHLSPLDALYAFEDLGAHTFIPIAYGSFLTSYEPLDEPLAWLSELVRTRQLGARVTVLEHGQTCLVREPPPARSQG
jgi:L-ascorbate metabolism protein UlaG (beta-lactamase superfamily)